MMLSIIAEILASEWSFAEKRIIEAINKRTKNDHVRKWLLEYAKGSFLIKHPWVQDFEVFEHYFIPENHCNIYIIDKDEQLMFGFIIDDNDLVQYGLLEKYSFNEYLCAESLIVPRTIHDVIGEFYIPDAEEVPMLYQPE